MRSEIGLSNVEGLRVTNPMVGRFPVYPIALFYLVFSFIFLPHPFIPPSFVSLLLRESCFASYFLREIDSFSPSTLKRFPISGVLFYLPFPILFPCTATYVFPSPDCTMFSCWLPLEKRSRKIPPSFLGKVRELHFAHSPAKHVRACGLRSRVHDRH